MTDIRKRVGRDGRATYQVRFRGPRGYEYRTFDSAKEARAFREDATAQKRASRRGATTVTVEQGVQKWLDICEKEGRDGREPVTRYTLDNYEYRAEIIKSYDWDKDLQELSKPDIVQFRSWLLQNHSRDVSSKVLTSFHSMIKELVGRGELSQDIAAGVHVTASSRYDEPVVIPSERDIQQLLATADRLANSKNLQTQRTWLRYRPMLYLAVDSGMRPQEYLALARASIRDKGVEVDRALDGGGTEISVTKTRAGRRFIDLSPDTLDMVRHYARHHAIENDYDLVFPTRTGKWQSVRNWRSRGFAAVCEEAGLMVKEKIGRRTIERPKYKPYDLRHFYASMLIDQRVNLKRIQTLMGHRNIQTTLNVYGHLIERVEAQEHARVSVLSCMNRATRDEHVATVT
ncbi:MAG: integrase [Acidobacteria bacterium SCN 69-37]|nr:MAG: integrase [Acidobacteria bacterium SCN 69-37]